MRLYCVRAGKRDQRFATRMRRLWTQVSRSIYRARTGTAGTRKAGRVNHYPVSATYTPDGWESPGFAYEDYTRAHTEQHLGREPQWVPEFALNANQLQIVLMVRAWHYVYGSNRHFSQNENEGWEELNRAATEKALQGHGIKAEAAAEQFAKIGKHIEAVKRAGGYLQLQGAIAFRAWRLNQDSITVADSLGLTSMTVRVNLQRLRNTAERLGFPVGKHHPTRGTKRRRFEAVPISPPATTGNWRNPLGLTSHESYASYCEFLGIPAMTFELWAALSRSFSAHS
jgi:hypothetical protein